MKVPLTKHQLTQHLIDQLIFLGNSARLFDDGCRREAVRMATQLRILFHETDKSKALIFQLGLKEFQIKSAVPGEVPEGQNYFHGYGKAEEVEGRHLRLVPDLSPVFFDELPLQKWWNQPIWKLDRGTVITRHDLILYAANTDGGAHVDAKVHEVYAKFSAPGAGGKYLRPTRHGAVLEYSEDAHLVALREIAHEVLNSPWESVAGVGPEVCWYQGPLAKRQRSAQLSLRKSLRRNLKSKRLA
jgi:hypothetical protein